MAKQEEAERQVNITRVVNAPRELVFKAWSDPGHLTRWYAPVGCTIDIRTLDFRPGGVFHHCIRSPHFHDCWCRGTYLEIVVPERIVYSMVVTDEAGNTVNPADMGMHKDWPVETIVTVTFTGQKGKTKIELFQTVSESLAKHTGAYPSWLEMFDRLSDELQKDIEKTDKSHH